MNYTAADRIREEEANQLYRKKGRKYIPVANHYECDGWKDGWYLVKIHEGVSKRTTFRPDHAEFNAAMKDNVEKIIPIISEALDIEPQKKPLSKNVCKAWESFVKKWGSEFRCLQHESINAVSERIIEALSKK